MLALTAGMETLVKRTSCPKNEKAEKDMTVWCFEHWIMEVKAGGQKANASSEQFGNALWRYLCKRRMVAYVARKCQGKDDPEAKYETGKEPSKVIQSTCLSMENFRLAGLSTTSSSSLPWLLGLPESLNKIKTHLQNHQEV